MFWQKSEQKWICHFKTNGSIQKMNTLGSFETQLFFTLKIEISYPIWIKETSYAPVVLTANNIGHAIKE